MEANDVQTNPDENLILPSNPPDIDSMSDEEVQQRVNMWRDLNAEYLNFVTSKRGGPEFKPLLDLHKEPPSNPREELAIFHRYALTAVNHPFLKQGCSSTRTYTRMALNLLNEPVTYNNVYMTILVPSIKVPPSAENPRRPSLLTKDYVVTVKTQNGEIIAENVSVDEIRV